MNVKTVSSLVAVLVLISGTSFGLERKMVVQQTAGKTGGETKTRSVSKSSTSRPVPKMSDQQKANVEKLVADLQAIKTGSQVTQEQKNKLALDLKTLAQGANKPSKESVEKLATDFSAALQDKQISKDEQAALTTDFQQVLNSANISPSEVETVVKDAQEILVASGITKEDGDLIVSDLKAIAAEIQKNLQSSKNK